MADKPLVNPSPKSVVLQDKKWVEGHRNIIQMSVVTNSINYALLEYQRSLVNKAKDGNEAAAAHYKITGALEFINVFKNLAEPVDIGTKTPPAQQLNQNA